VFPVRSLYTMQKKFGVEGVNIVTKKCGTDWICVEFEAEPQRLQDCGLLPYANWD
jgi:hypothetical protein